MTAATPRRFADPRAVVQSWYVAARSRAVAPGRVARAEPAGRPLVLWRGVSGAVYAADAHCPHLGAHLGHGSVEGDELVCALHHFRYAPDGRLAEAPGAGNARLGIRLRTYPVTERWGFVWVWHGPEALFPLPGPEPHTRLRAVALPSQRFHCHHHLIAVNACDTMHLGPLHGLELTHPPEVSFPDPFHGSMHLRGRFREAWKQALTGCANQPFDATFLVSGGNSCWVDVHAPVPFQVLFAGRPDPKGGSRTQSFVFLPPGSARRAIEIAALLMLLLKRDHEILDDISFRRGFTAGDRIFESFIRQIDAMPVF